MLLLGVGQGASPEEDTGGGLWGAAGVEAEDGEGWQCRRLPGEQCGRRKGLPPVAGVVSTLE